MRQIVALPIISFGTKRSFRPSSSIRLASLLVSAGFYFSKPQSLSSSPFSVDSSRTRQLIVSNGLVNCGNTCYLAAQLQCAFHIPRVRLLVLNESSAVCADTIFVNPSSNEGEREIERISLNPGIVRRPQAPPSIACQSLRLLFQDMIRSKTPASPVLLCQSLGIQVREQQDSQEFWKLLLPALQLSELTDLYQGAFQDYIRALDGSNRERRREETFLDISLDVASINSVNESLRNAFGNPEILRVAEGNGWRAEKGSDPIDAHKGSILTPHGLPSILQLHLKRFYFDWKTDTTTKLNTPFHFPLELNLRDICDDAQGVTDNELSFKLQAIVVHKGEYGSGHYYAYVRPDVRYDTWYRFNDQLVDTVTYDDVYMDSCGGTVRTAIPETDKLTTTTNWFRRLTQAWKHRDSFGYGGRTSSAYVLQYVRQSSISMLYDVKDD